METLLWAIGGGFAGTWMLMWKLCDKTNERIDKVNERIDKLSDKVEDIDRRLCRIEGSLSTQGHCLFNQNNPEKKAK